MGKWIRKKKRVLKSWKLWIWFITRFYFHPGRNPFARGPCDVMFATGFPISEEEEINRKIHVRVKLRLYLYVIVR